MSTSVKRAWKLGCGVAALIAVVGLLALWGMGLGLARAVYIMPSASRRINHTPTEALGPGTVRVNCPTTDGTYSPGWYHPGTSGAAIVLLHGLGGTREQLATFGRRFLGQGWGVLLIDQRGHGEHPSELTTFGRAEALDALAAVEWLRERDEVDPERIGLFGASMGATTVIYAAARDTHLACAVADSSYSALREHVFFEMERVNPPINVPPTWRRFFAWAFQRYSRRIIGEWADAPDPVDAVRDIRCPLFLIHGEQDRRIDPDDLDELARAAREAGVDVTSWKVRDAGHCRYHGSDEFSRRLSSFFRTHLSTP